MDVYENDDTEIRRLEEEFTRWGVWISDTGMWWASLREALTLAQIRAGCSPFTRGGSAQELRTLLYAQEELMAGVVPS